MLLRLLEISPETEDSDGPTGGSDTAKWRVWRRTMGM